MKPGSALRLTGAKVDGNQQSYIRLVNPLARARGQCYRPLSPQNAIDYDPEQSCCCLLTLKQGGIVIGIVQLALYSVALAAGLYFLHTDAGDSELPATERREAYIGATVLFITHVTFSSLLIHGARADSRRAVLAWLCYHGLITVLQTAGALVALIELVAVKQRFTVVLAVVVASLAVLVPAWYFFSVGVRLCKKLSERKSMTHSLKGRVDVPLMNASLQC